MDLLQWHELLYLLPLTVGLLLSVGTATGLHGHDAGLDVDSDVEIDGGVDANLGFLNKAGDVLGLGRVPLTLWLSTAPLLFGATGFLTQRALTDVLAAPVPMVLVSLPLAAVCGAWGTGRLARMLGRVLPPVESYAISRQDLVGRTGIVVLACDSTTGLAQIRDARAGMHQVRCRTSAGRLAKGAEVLVIDYDAGVDVFIIDATPADVRTSAPAELGAIAKR